MTEKKTDEIKKANENVIHHPIYNDCSYENIIPLKFIGLLNKYKDNC